MLSFPYEKIYEIAQEDLSIYGILSQAVTIYEGYQLQLTSETKTITEIIFAYYTAWFFQLSSRLSKDPEIDPHAIQKYLKSFQPNSFFSDKIRKSIEDVIEKACQKLTWARPYIDLPEDIQSYLRKTLAGFQHFSEVDEFIRNGIDASLRVFPNIKTSAFEKAYQIYRKAFLNHVQWHNVCEALESKDLSRTMNAIKSLEDPQYLIMPIVGSEPWTLFHRLCQDGSVDLVKKAIDQLGHLLVYIPNLVKPKRWDPKYLNQRVFMAAQAGENQTIDLCLTLGADINARGPGTKKTALDMAAEKGHTHCVKHLIAKGISVDQGEGVWTALLLALKNPEVTKQHIEPLLKARVDIDARGPNKQTGLHIAVQAKRGDMVELLLQHGAETDKSDTEGNTPLHLAAMLGFDAICQHLINRGASIGIKNAKGQTAVDLASQHGHSSLAGNMKRWREKAMKEARSFDVEHLKFRLTYQEGIIKERDEAIEAMRQEITALKNANAILKEELAPSAQPATSNSAGLLTQNIQQTFLRPAPAAPTTRPQVSEESKPSLTS